MSGTHEKRPNPAILKADKFLFMIQSRNNISVFASSRYVCEQGLFFLMSGANWIRNENIYFRDFYSERFVRNEYQVIFINTKEN